MAVITLTIAIAFGVGACKKRPAPDVSSGQPAPEQPAGSLTPERRAWMEESQRRADVAEARDHAELVRPAPLGFMPEPVRAKLALKLVLESARIRKTEPLRYRLEIQNVAREPYTFIDSPHSFVKDGSLSDTFFKAYLIDPTGRQKELESPLGGMAQVYELKLPNERYLNDQQKHEELAEVSREAKSQRELMVTLKPGEILLTRAEPAKTRFRPLDADLTKLKPGPYKLRFVYERPKLYGSEDVDIPIILHMKSNAVSFEVAP